MIFTISDLHFCHKNIINFCKRPFSNINEMNEALIANINKIVMPTDILIICGDFGFIGVKKGQEILNRINCKNLQLILGKSLMYIINRSYGLVQIIGRINFT